MTVERMCAVCRKRRPKKELLRIAKGADGVLRLDQSGKLPGRGMYICRDSACLKNAEKRRVIERSLKTAGGNIYDEIKAYGEDMSHD
ncbi:MAG: RNase P modulator RnpM [Monoglobaceae bacterium]